jgi:hypothetical protein
MHHMIACLQFFTHYSVVVAGMAFLLVQLQKQLDEVCYNHTPGMHTSIVTSQIIFAYNNFTHIDCNRMNLL